MISFCCMIPFIYWYSIKIILSSSQYEMLFELVIFSDEHVSPIYSFILFLKKNNILNRASIYKNDKSSDFLLSFITYLQRLNRTSIWSASPSPSEMFKQFSLNIRATRKQSDLFSDIGASFRISMNHSIVYEFVYCILWQSNNNSIYNINYMGNNVTKFCNCSDYASNNPQQKKKEKVYITLS